MKVASDDDFKSKILVKGRGVNSPDPTLDLALPVTVQLVNSSNVCFESVLRAQARFRRRLT